MYVLNTNDHPSVPKIFLQVRNELCQSVAQTHSHFSCGIWFATEFENTYLYNRILKL